MTPPQEEWNLRQDVYVGVTACLPVINAYYRGDDTVMEDFHKDGAVPGFFYYPLDDIPADKILDLRDDLCDEISQMCGEAIVFIGGATGMSYGYLDFIAWNLKSVLNAAVVVFKNSPVKEALFHSFRRNVGSVRLKGE